MRVLFVFAIALFLCPLAQWFGLVAPAPPTPLEITETPAAASPGIAINADADSVQVGDTIRLSGVPVSIGIPYYTLTLSSGASATITYYGEVQGDTGDGYLARDSIFEIMSAQADMNQVTFLLRALAPGSAEAVISATGEVRTAEGAFMWGGGASESLTLTVSE